MVDPAVRLQVLAGSAEFRTLNTPDKDRPKETKEVAKLYRQLYRVSPLRRKNVTGHAGTLCLSELDAAAAAVVAADRSDFSCVVCWFLRCGIVFDSLEGFVEDWPGGVRG